MTKFLIFALCFLSTTLSAQDRYFTLLDGWVNSICLEMEEADIFLGLNIIGTPIQHEYMCHYVDSDGLINESHLFRVDSVESTAFISTSNSNFARISETEIITAGYVDLDLSEEQYLQEGTLVKFNIISKEFDVIHISELNTATQYNCIEMLNDSTLFVAGRSKTLSTEEQNTIYNMDFEGNIRWSKTIYGDCLYCFMTPKQILPLSNGNIAYLYENLDDLILDDAQERAIIVILDGETGEQIGDEILLGDYENYRIYAGGMLELENGELMVSYSQPYMYDGEGDWDSNFDNTFFLSKINIETGNVTWSTDLSDPLSNGTEANINGFAWDVSQMQWLEDGHILLSGTSGVSGILCKIDLMGSIIWYNAYQPYTFEENPIGQFTKIFHTSPTSDGGFMCAGQYFAYPGGPIHPGGIQTAIALKVDEYGCLIEDCHVGIDELSSANNLSIYPNPSNGVFSIDLEIGEEYSVVVHSPLGKLIKEEKSIQAGTYLLDINDQPSGVYYVTVLTAGNKKMSAKIIKL